MPIRKNRDRSRCRVCGIKLSIDNAYPRSDTANGLHAYCKSCYLVIQKERAANIKSDKYTILVKRGSYAPIRIYFDTPDDKREFSDMRRLQSIGYRSCLSDNYNMEDSTLKCDICGSSNIIYDGGCYVCQDCNMCLDIVPFLRESPLPMLKGRTAWYGESADEQCIDRYYSQAYGK